MPLLLTHFTACFNNDPPKQSHHQQRPFLVKIYEQCKSLEIFWTWATFIIFYAKDIYKIAFRFIYLSIYVSIIKLDSECYFFFGMGLVDGRWRWVCGACGRCCAVTIGATCHRSGAGAPSASGPASLLRSPHSDAHTATVTQVTLHHAGHTAAGHGGRGHPRHPHPRPGAAPQPGHRPGGGHRRTEGDLLQVSRWAAPGILHPTHIEVTNNIGIAIVEHLNHC